MAEFCLDCWNKINGHNDPPEKYVISKELDLCEECGKMTNVIVAVRRFYPLYRLCSIIALPFKYLIQFIIDKWGL